MFYDFAGVTVSYAAFPYFSIMPACLRETSAHSAQKGPRGSESALCFSFRQMGGGSVFSLRCQEKPAPLLPLPQMWACRPDSI